MIKKIIETTKISDWEILTDEGFSNLLAIHKTIPYKKWKLKTKSFDLNCADNHIVFVNNFFPKFVKDLLPTDLIQTKNGPEEIKEFFSTNVYINMYDAEVGDINHRYYTNGILSHNTSTLFILAQGHPYLYINASSERGIDTIREKISNFCSMSSLEDGKENLKCVILDEIDGATGEFFSAFKASMERYSNTTRFIASCNFLQKIPEAVYKSRFLTIAYDPIDAKEQIYLIGEYKKRVGAILKATNIIYTEGELEKFVMNDFPDLRAILNKIQSLYLREVKELTPENIATSSDFHDLFHLCLQPSTKPYENYKIIINQYGTQIDEALSTLGTDFPEYLKNIAPAKLDKLPLVLIAIAEYQYQVQFVIDKLISLLACVFRIQQILNS